MKRMKYVKRFCSIFLVVTIMLMLSVPAAAARKPDPVGEVNWKEPPLGEYATPADYSKTDLSKPYEVIVYSTTVKSDDEDMVVDEINKVLSERGFNTTVKLVHIVASGGINTYSLALASGELIDVIYAAPWKQMWVENAKGSFMFLNDEPDWIANYMPLIHKNQDPESWSEVTSGGKIMAVPTNLMSVNVKYPIVRQDLMEKYGFSELKSWDDGKKFAITIAEKETPQSGIFALNASVDNMELWRTYIQQENRFPIYGELFHYVYRDNGAIPNFKEDVKCYFETDLFRKFAHDTKELANAGVWSKSAQSNTVTVQDSFANLTSASYFHNSTVFTYGQRAEKNPGIKTTAYDIFPEALVVPQAYSNNCLTIPASSGNPERAAMIIDLFKNDFQIWSLINFGLEGVHYTDNGDNTFTRVVDKIGKVNLGDIWWGVNGKMSKAYEEKTDDTRAKEMELSQIPRMKANPTVSFIFDDQIVKNELAAINALANECRPMLELGLAEDVDAYLDKFIADMYAAGLQNVYDEMELQYNTWKESRRTDTDSPTGDTNKPDSASSTGTVNTPAGTDTTAADSSSGWIIWVVTGVVVLAVTVTIIIVRTKKKS